MANKYIKITEQIESKLYRFIEYTTKSREKKRAMAILLNSQKISIFKVADKLEVNQDAVYETER